MYFRYFITACLFLLFPSALLAEQILTTVAITSTSQGVQIVSSIKGGTVVTVPSDAANGVWLAKTERTCSTTLTSGIGYYIAIGQGFDFLPKEDGYSGQICGILPSGGSSVTVSVNSR